MKKSIPITFTMSILMLLSSLSMSHISYADTSVYIEQELWKNGNTEVLLEFYGEGKGSGDFYAHVNRGALYRSISDYKSAITEYERYLLSGKISEMEQRSVYLPLAESYYYSARYKDAEKYFRKILKLDPRLPGALFGIGRTLFSMNRLDEAESYLMRAIDVTPGFQGNYIYLARIREKKGLLNEAALYYRTAIKKDSHHIEIRYALGNVYEEQNLKEKAYMEYHRILNTDSENGIVGRRADRILTELAKKPEDMIRPKKLEKFCRIRVLDAPAEVPIVRIGLNTSSSGRMNPFDKINLLTNCTFKILSSSGLCFEGRAEVEYLILMKNGRAVISYHDSPGVMLPQQFAIELDDTVNGSMILRNIHFGKGFAWGGIEDRQYRRKLDVTADKDGFRVVNEIKLEEYLYGVVPSEMMVSYPQEALKAQAVIARSYALYRKKHVRPHMKNGFDLCDSQHCQVYKGVSNEWKKTNDVVDATRGEILKHNKRIVDPLFHSNCGGHTVSSGELSGWGSVSYLTGKVDGDENIVYPASPAGFEDWLKSKPDAYCNIPLYGGESELRWFRIIPAGLLEEKLNRKKRIGRIKMISVKKRCSSGHAAYIYIQGTEGDLTIEREHKIRRLLGIGPIRSTLFWIETKFGSDGLPEEFILYGGGWGHGVGMCQDGAAGMAARGLLYDAILEHYYMNTYIEKLTY
ncbi:MAG: SpoIID/LytB domain-containing protein [Elusimicrobiota bacterium]